MNNPDLEPRNHFFGFDVDPGWRQFGSGIRDGDSSDPGSGMEKSEKDTHPGSATLLWTRIVLMRIRSRIRLKILMRIRIRIRIQIRVGGGGVGQPKMCIPPGKILGTPLHLTMW